jgi:hypothetical protein
MKLPTIAAGAGVAVLAVTLAGAQPAAQQQAPAAAPQPTASQAQAREILMRMARYLSTLPAFSVTVNSNYDVLQASGQKIEFGERRKLVVNRPDRLSVETERSDGARTAAVFTGTDMVLVDLTNGVYASERQPGSLDEGILHFVSDLGMRLPLAALLMSRLPLEFERRVRSIDYVEKTNLFATPSHHLAARGDTVDFQVWVTDGAQPLPLRVVLTYKNEPGQPEFRANFADWNRAPVITAATFKPPIPDGAHKILFAAQLEAVRAAGQGGKP